MITYSYYNRSFMHYTRKSLAMNNNPMNEILQELRKPFHPTHITWKPGMMSKDQGKALALAYADLRAYQNRLDEICGMDWSVTYTPWGDRIVCHLTIQGITRSSSGEPDSQSERSEIAGTSAEAQSFKRACAMFGLGRYLYNLPNVWVEYDPATKQFTDKAKAKLEGIIVQHYRRTVTDDAEQSQAATIQRRETPEEAHKPETPTQASVEPQPENGEVAQPENEAAPDTTPDPLREQFDQLGESLYGEQWAQVSRHNVERITGGKAVETRALTTEQIQKLVDGMKKLQRKRHTAPVLQQNGHALA
ncbi:hypothetical protein BH10CHL1_BH10CHL1_17760 [soil metagenome]